MDEGVKKSTMSKNINFAEKFKENLNTNVSLSNYSWFNLGGKAEFFLNQKIKNNF